MDLYPFGSICNKKDTHIGITPFIRSENIKNQSYDSLLIEVNHLMVPKRTFSCFVVDILKYCGVELPLAYTRMGINKEV